MGQLGRAGYPNQLRRGSDRNANLKLPPDPLAKCKHLEAESIFHCSMIAAFSIG